MSCVCIEGARTGVGFEGEVDVATRAIVLRREAGVEEELVGEEWTADGEAGLDEPVVILLGDVELGMLRRYGWWSLPM